jgi:maltose alpha-D-glucosyltransferase / alpha-amylase
MKSHEVSQQSLPWFEANSLMALLLDPLSERLGATLSEYIKQQRWFRGKARSVGRLEVLDVVPLPAAGTHELVLACLRVEYEGSDPAEVYVMPLARSSAGLANESVPLFGLRGADSIVYDPSGSDALSDNLLQLYRERALGSARGHLDITADEPLRKRLAPGTAPLKGHGPSGDQSNTTLFYGQELMLKVFRQLEDGVNPDVEICRFLWKHGYRHAPEPLGQVQYTSPSFQATLSAVQRYVPSQGNAWEVVTQALRRALSVALQKNARVSSPELPRGDLLASAREALPDSIAELIGSLAPLVKQLAQRSAELHLCLASDRGDPAFSPEPFDARYQRSIVENASARLTQVFGLLRKQLPNVAPEYKALAEHVLGLHDALERQLEGLPEARVQADRIRCHGDYHLGQVLFTASANDFVIIDFEGEPALPLAVRRLKHSALYDVCGMLRSFHYAATVATFEVHAEHHDPQERQALSLWADAFYRWSSALFLGSYLQRARQQPGEAVFLPQGDDHLRAFLRLHMLDKCAYELGYELNNRPDWVLVPLTGLVNLSQTNHGHTR